MSKEEINSLKKKIEVNGSVFDVFSLKSLEKNNNYEFSKLPISIKILLENVLRNYDGTIVNDLKSFLFYRKIIKLKLGRY